MYPENAAYPIGGERNDRYLLIEIHYDNPGMETGNACSYNSNNIHLYSNYSYVHIASYLLNRKQQLSMYIVHIMLCNDFKS